MKHLLLTLLFSASLAAFSQVSDTTQPLRQHDGSNLALGISAADGFTIELGRAITGNVTYPKPDTLRAIILVTMCRRCAAEPMPGYVVIEPGKRPVYLDRCKKALKWPQVGWGYELIDPNYKK